jgi:uncharacterized coiled-coil protein SlyX
MQSTKEQVMPEVQRFRSFLPQTFLINLSTLVKEATKTANEGRMTESQRGLTRKAIASAKSILEELDAALDSQPSEAEHIEQQIKDLQEKLKNLKS